VEYFEGGRKEKKEAKRESGNKKRGLPSRRKLGVTKRGKKEIPSVTEW